MGESPVKGFFRPSGAPCRTRLFPWLAPWATFSRPSGADAHESYQQNVETPGAGAFACQPIFLPAAGAWVEVQVDGIAGQGDADKVADIDSQALGRANDVHVVCLYGEIQFCLLYTSPSPRD